MLRLTLLAILSVLVTACTTTSIADYFANAAPPKHRKLVVVIDGTGNDPRDHTNAFRLHELIANQNRDDIATFYTEGVGSHGRVIGLVAGMGMARDVRDAYRFLAERWLPGDEIYIIGFSRGAYAGRILQGMIFTAGLVDLPPGSTKLGERQRIVDRLYDANKMYRTKREQDDTNDEEDVQKRRQKRVTAVLDDLGLQKREARIHAVAYWDTVAAMGLPDDGSDPETEDMALPYLDQFCNVDHVFHAMSLDDNRPKDFTPLPATGQNRLAMCKGWPKPTIDEVWFSGAHADLGGTYIVGDAIDGYLAGVSLNWMLARLSPFDLTPPRAAAYANWRDVIHDARDFFFVYKLRPDDSRDVFSIVGATGYGEGMPRVHFTVEDRLKELYTLPALNGQCSRERKPKILCRDWIEQSRFMRELKDRKTCLVPVTDPISSRMTGWRFAEPRAGATEFEIQTACVVVIYDTPEQRDAALRLL